MCVFPRLGHGGRVPQKRDATLFTDPQTVTINAVAQTLPRVPPGKNSGAFAKDDGTVKLSISQGTAGKKSRRLVALDHSKIAADPLMADVNVKLSMRAYLVVETPEVGYTVAEAKQIVDALTAYLTASSGANVTKILGGEA